jgi:hypothetical protein
MTEKYTRGGIREHILRMNNQASKLKPTNLALKKEFFIHLVFASLPKEYDTFVVNYNMLPEKWNLEKLMAICAQEEYRIKIANGGTINYVKDNKKRNFNANSSKAQGKAPMQNQSQQKKFTVKKNQCLHCKKTGHYKKDCPNFLKMIMTKKGENIIMFINESLYVQYSKSTWWIDSGATVHVANSLQGFRSTRTMQRRERCVKVTNGVQADVEAIGDLSLELADGFTLLLRDVLYVPCLDSDGYDCNFGNDKCKIMFNNACVGLAFLQGELYLLSLCENVNSVCDVNEHVSSSANVNRKRKRTHDALSKL